MADLYMPAYTLLDLFAGAGGLTRGFVDAGFVPIAAVESDPDAAASYAANFGPHVYAGKIEAFAAGPLAPSVDVVIGGPPCQGFSNLGSRRLDDPRNRLWRTYAEVVRRTRPYVFVIENVDRFADSAQLATLRWHCRRGGMLDGYNIAFCDQLNTADFGVPQRRIRTIVIGTLRELSSVVAPTPTHARPGTGAQAWLTVDAAFRRSPAVPKKIVGVELPSDDRFELLLPDGSLVTRRGPFRSDALHLGRCPKPESVERFESIPPGGNWRNLPDRLKASCWLNRTTSGSGDVMGRLRPNEPSVTIRTEFFKPEKGRYLHPTENRPITHFEAARLMGFRDDHLWCGSKTEIARQIGNAVPPPLAEAVARAVLATMTGAGAEPKRTRRVA